MIYNTPSCNVLYYVNYLCTLFEFFFLLYAKLKNTEKIIKIVITKIKTNHTNTYRSHQSRNMANFRNISGHWWHATINESLFMP